jgi:CubicO group peptidase (beta-lactamase class C family)
MVLSHQSGLPAVDVPLTLAELAAGREDDVIGRQQPYWTPGTRHGYHAFTFGTLLDGIVHRVTGRRLGDHVARLLSEPLQLDLWLGLPETEQHRLQPISRPRLATTERVVATTTAATIPPGHLGRLARTEDVYNDPRTAAAGFPAVGGVAAARDLARLFAATLDTVDGVRILDEDGRQAMVNPLSDGIDAVLGIPIRFGSGVQLPFPQLPLLGPSSFGHEGAGGSVAMADPDFGLSIGYTTNVFPPLMGSGVGFDTLLATVRHCLTH